MRSIFQFLKIAKFDYFFSRNKYLTKAAMNSINAIEVSKLITPTIAIIGPFMTDLSIM